MEITDTILREIAPGGKQTNFKLFPDLARWMNEWFPHFGIDTNGEYCHILAQLAHESNSFNTLEEYASGAAYEGRKDLGNTEVGDGVRFKGRGPIQITGRLQYLSLGIKLHKPNMFIDNPELLETPQWGVWSACTFWDERHLNDIANMSDSAGIFSKKLNRALSPLEYITWRINGGFNGYESRKIFYYRCKDIFK